MNSPEVYADPPWWQWDTVPAKALAAFCTRRPGDFKQAHDARLALTEGIASLIAGNLEVAP